MRIAIISCASKKANYACSAYEMYSVSNTFKIQADLVFMMYNKYYIMSAKYGIITPNKEIEPYNLTLHTKRLTSGNLITEEAKVKLKIKIKKQIEYLLSEGYEIDFHLSNDYYNLLSLNYQNHSKIRHIKPQKLQSVTVQLYKEGIKMFDSGSSKEEVINYLSNTIKTGNENRESEQPSWWYHPIEDPFWGRSHELAKKYRLNDGNLFMHYHQDTVQTKHVMGWTNQLDNLKQLKQTEQDSWRICSSNDIPFITENRLHEIELYKQNNIPKKIEILKNLNDLDNLDDLNFKSKLKLSTLNKTKLQLIINKYFLNGLVESVKWVIKDKSLHIIFNTPNKAMIGEIEYTGIDLPDSEIAIYDTSQLDKLISITTGELNLNVVEHKLIIEDMNYTLSYPLADSLLIQTPKQVNESNGYHIECALETEHLSNIIKAKNALASDHLIFTITKNFDGDNVLTIIFGNNESYTNKIEYMIANSNIDTNVNPMFNLPFDSEAIKVVMANNKDADDINMKLNTNGLLKLEFEGENWKSKYFFVRKAE